MLRFAHLFLGGLLLAAPLAAQEAEAQAQATVGKHIDKLLARPFVCDGDFKLDAKDNNSSGKFQVAFVSFKKFAFDLDMTVQEAGVEDAQTGKFRFRADGTNLFVEVDESGSGDVQAFQLQLDLVEKLMKSNVQGMTPEPKMFVDGFQQLSTKLPFTKQALEGSMVRYTTAIGPGKTHGIELLEGMDEVIHLSLDFDSKTSFPHAMKMWPDDDEGTLAMKMANVKFPETVSDEKFSYSAPDGVMLQDLTPMFQMMIDAAAAEEDEEF